MGGLLDLMAPDPNLRRGGLLSPIGWDKNEDWHFTYPKIAIDAAKTFDNLGTAMRLPHGTSPKHPAYKSVFDAAGAINLPSLLRKGATSTVGMNLWHGGPNKWAAEPGFPQGRPRLDKIGEGEGAQAYGHGFYSAEKPDVAKQYSPRDYDAEEIMMQKYKQAERSGDYEAMEVWENAMMHETPNELRKRYNNADYDESMKSTANRVADELGKIPTKSQLYKIDIPDEDVAKYIDWDAPLSAQSEFIQKSLSGIMEPDFRVYPKGQKQPISQKFETQAEADSFLKSLGDDASVYEVKGSGSAASGAEIYRKLIDIHGSPEKASEFLKSIGIPGTRFLDEGSRVGTQQNATHNYVTWDQKVLNRAKVLQRNEEIFNQLTKAGIPFT
jgi:hypothetical protein